MFGRKIKLPPESQYPVEPWRFVQKQINKKMIGRDESIFTTSNGYIGIRGSYEEGEPVMQQATFISGYHETWPIIYGEEAFGFAKTGQTMLPVTDASVIKLFVDDEPFSLRHAYLTEFERALDFKNGYLERNLIWDTAAGKSVRVNSKRIVSIPERHMAAIEYEVTMLNDDAHLAIVSEVFCEQISSEREQKKGHDPRIDRTIPHRVFHAMLSKINGERIVLGHQTFNSQLKIVCGIDHHLSTKCKWDFTSEKDEFKGKVTYIVEAKKDMKVTLVKYISYHTSSPHPSFSEVGDRTERTLDRAKTYGFNKILKDQRKYLDDYWKKCDVVFHNNDLIQQIVRLNHFHLLQASARIQNSGIGAKGLTGSGYEGHAFWDIEIYMMPYLIFNNPRVAKNILLYRYNMLDKAREWAQMLSHKGALFPWRTINGEEASAFFAAGTAQYHINADISYAVQKYTKITQDIDFLCEYGAEMIIETARLWEDLGFYTPDGKFHIHGVTGPDEYNAIVNDNAFTNLMAKENIRAAIEAVEYISKKHPKKFELLVHKTGFENDEIKAWKRAADNMYVPYDKGVGINPQDESFLQKEVWDFENTPKEKYPLLLHYHPLHLYRFQVIKQADVVLAMFLLGENFSKELKKRNFDYYDPLTTGDSSLSACIQGIMAAELGYRELATKYFTYSLMMDIANIGGNVEHGLHLASMGGIWMSVVYGIGGLRDFDGKLDFNPIALNNKNSNGIEFKLPVNGSLLSVSISSKDVTYLIEEGTPYTFTHCGEEVSLKKGESKRIKLN